MVAWRMNKRKGRWSCYGYGREEEEEETAAAAAPENATAGEVAAAMAAARVWARGEISVRRREGWNWGGVMVLSLALARGG